MPRKQEELSHITPQEFDAIKSLVEGDQPNLQSYIDRQIADWRKVFAQQNMGAAEFVQFLGREIDAIQQVAPVFVLAVMNNPVSIFVYLRNPSDDERPLMLFGYHFEQDKVLPESLYASMVLRCAATMQIMRTHVMGYSLPKKFSSP